MPTLKSLQRPQIKPGTVVHSYLFCDHINCFLNRLPTTGQHLRTTMYVLTFRPEGAPCRQGMTITTLEHSPSTNSTHRRIFCSPRGSQSSSSHSEPSFFIPTRCIYYKSTGLGFHLLQFTDPLEINTESGNRDPQN